MQPIPANNPLYPGSVFPNAVDQISSQPDREIPDAIMAIQATLTAVPGAPALAPPANLSTPGTITVGGAVIRGGTGAPGAALGAVGDYYFRTDTPGTANQRIYVKTAAATWTGIV